MKKELTKEEKADLIFKLVEDIKNKQSNAVNNFLDIGRILNIIQTDKLWQFYGSHIMRFDDFLKEIRMGRATAYNCMAIWREFGAILKSKSLDICYFRLIRLLPVVKSGDKEDWIEKAVSLPETGFNDEIREAKGLPATDSCEHPADEREYYSQCKRCGKWIKQ